MTSEKRYAAGVAVNGRKLTGYIAKWDSPTVVGDFTEVIRRGAFASSLASGADVLCLADHDYSRVLGRTRSGTLSLAEDDTGLSFALDLPDTQAGRDLATLAQRGDLGGCSFAFNVPTGGDHWNGNTRELRNVLLDEVSIVQSRPAYGTTEVHLRSLQPQAQHTLLHYWLETCR